MTNRVKNHNFVGDMADHPNRNDFKGAHIIQGIKVKPILKNFHLTYNRGT